ncbi:NUDIX hydrolase [Pseudonocardia bannensis]|uniref:NUDIX hydrolase n=1 Tax=Pseudonocardia bannensis TaxID=630973 RepID=A0A848DQ24_9PSEU|nr:NUDIX hydrolase [Pseudonocardia bannensis]NMH94937.1 NUDIX hydrolase [Pseudonocardia bannensis]
MTETPAGLDADVLAAGAVLWRDAEGRDGSDGGDAPEVAVVHRPRYDDWSLPKGKLDQGESMPAAAVREVSEETGYRARLGARLGDVRYDVPEGSKLVRYWAAEAQRGGPGFVPNHETDELRWLSPREASRLLTYDRDREVLDRFTAQPVPESTLLLVRHAKAGNRQSWSGDDAQRPLSGTGRAQADQLAGLLRLFGPERLHSATPVRCTQTLAPLAEELGVGITEEPLLGEEGFARDPAAGLARFRELFARPGVTVLCSQGGVIPEVLEQLTRESGLLEHVVDDSGAVPSRKASTWVLGRHDDRVRFADYYRSPSA